METGFDTSLPAFCNASPKLGELVGVPREYFGVMHSKDPRHFLVSSPLIVCAGLFGYDSVHKVGFLAHFGIDTDVSLGIEKIASRLRNIAVMERKSFRTSFVYSTSSDLDLRDALENAMGNFKDSSLRFLITDSIELPDWHTQIGVDVSQGGYFHYCPSRWEGHRFSRRLRIPEKNAYLHLLK